MIESSDIQLQKLDKLSITNNDKEDIRLSPQNDIQKLSSSMKK